MVAVEVERLRIELSAAEVPKGGEAAAVNASSSGRAALRSSLTDCSALKLRRSLTTDEALRRLRRGATGGALTRCRQPTAKASPRRVEA